MLMYNPYKKEKGDEDTRYDCYRKGAFPKYKKEKGDEDT